jgi:hypothetical protein
VEIIISDTVLSKAPTLYVETRVVRDVHILSTSPGLEEDKMILPAFPCDFFLGLIGSGHE